ncbi:DUF4062 domain-containing protein [Psychrobacter sp. APC 3350]|uniref:DUF4062 domain-containing protein n=1 Tax=Psychrobacter sp. APC 3350 TaxID=3035195 RepID=UPI0025B3D4AA|nr:DUF4062 domain-containing protein [Psychrobacter sp. APC 3350]MDN3452026.1 DUF4062 domain-containing protein [Psychrobacter sp. APC 3350]
MPNRRYHIHVICADNDQLLVLDSLAIFFQTRAFLTYDVSSRLSKASLYGRQCIDSCDYAVMIVGDSYGTVQKNGVSQMHLSYLNAKAKLKPLIILVKNHHQETVISRQLQEFIKLVTKQDNLLQYYDTEEDIEPLLIQAHYNAVANNKMTGGWVRASEDVTITSNNISNKTTNEKPIDVSPSSNNIKEDRHIDEDLASDEVSEPLVLTEIFDIQYSAQAYEGGNLTDVTRSLTLSWQQILIVLIKMPSTFSSYGLQNAINRLITAKAEIEIKRVMPNVHAVSRCQISQADINDLQRQLVGANWIQLMTYSTRVSQELWKLTFYAKNLLQEHTSNTNKQD